LFLYYPEDAADASQETFMRVVRRNGTVKLDSPAGYIWRTAQNLVKEIKRTKALYSKWVSSQSIDLDQQISQTPTPEEAMKFQNINDNILNVLNRLPPRCREVFILHRFKGFSHKQIAERLNISTKTVENHMVNALLFFHKHLHLP
jgi:RNA polymerase sigma-70 factor (ECF subfamily)